MKKQIIYSILAISAGLSFTACSDDDPILTLNEGAYVGQNIGNFDASEWYPGGLLGTTSNTSAGCFEQEVPVVNDKSNGFYDAFFNGEPVMEKQYTVNNPPYNGLGPASVRTSCFDCHPAYGHGKWQASYTTRYGNGNGYLLVIYHPNGADANNSDGLSNDGGFISEVTGMPQTQAIAPFKAPIDESGIHMKWLALGKSSDETTGAQADNAGALNDVWQVAKDGKFCFPDGEEFTLIYPELKIDQAAFHTSPLPTDYAVRIETTIGLTGIGLIDAIPEDSIKAQYQKEYNYFASTTSDPSEFINKNFFDGSDLVEKSKYTLSDGYFIDDPNTNTKGMKRVKRYSYALTRAVLADANGANAVWNIPNVSRPDRPYLYTTNAWAKAMSEDPEVIAQIKKNPKSPYYADGTDKGITDAVLNLLSPKTNQFNNKWHNFTPEMSAEKFYEFMVWHRGLAIPRARNLNDPDVQRGKTLFMQWGCANCHRPKWQTTDDNYWMPAMLKGKTLPRFKNQTIYPYSDFVQHKMYMKNDVHGTWCRTTPLWGRGLEKISTGREDRMHDCRARNEQEAILWHMYNKKSHSYKAALNFYKAPKADRQAVIKFLQSI